MDRDKIIIKTSVQGIIMNVLLVIFKSIIGFTTNSIAVVLDALNNLSDVLSAVITIIGTKLAGKAPDKKHPYGHGRIEYIASAIIAIIVLAAGATAIKESIEKILNGQEANYTIVSLIIIFVAVIVKFLFGRYAKKVGEKINSGSLVATGSDALFDSLISLSTFVAAIVSMIWHISLEGILGIVIGIYIIKASIEMLKETINSVIGIRADNEISRKVKEIVNQFDEVQGTYDLILHNYGPTRMIGSVHIQVDDNMTAKEIHGLTKQIEAKVYTELGIILTIGIYASNTNDEETLKIKNELQEIIKKHDTVLQLHGFYVDTKTNTIMFDLIISFEEKNVEEVRDNVVKEIKEKYPKYNYYAVIDKDFSD